MEQIYETGRTISGLPMLSSEILTKSAHCTVTSLVTFSKEIAYHLSLLYVTLTLSTYQKSELSERDIFLDYLHINIYRCDKSLRRPSGVLVAVDRDIFCKAYSGHLVSRGCLILLTMQVQVYLTRCLLSLSQLLAHFLYAPAG